MGTMSVCAVVAPRDARRDRQNEIGPRDDERRHEEVRDYDGNASLGAVLFERVIDDSAATARRDEDVRERPRLSSERIVRPWSALMAS